MAPIHCEDRPNPANPVIDPQPLKTVVNDYTGYHLLDPVQQEIRILVIHPAAAKTNPIHCSLIKASLKSSVRPRYQAISYCWGDPAKTAVIAVQHLEHNTTLEGRVLKHEGSGISYEGLSKLSASKPFNITETLYSGLLEFRSLEAPLFLWADAICINQKNVKERSQQVSFMRTVYETATEVLVWLPTQVPQGVEPEFDGLALLSGMLTSLEILAGKSGIPYATLALEISRSAERLREFWNDVLSSCPDFDGDESHGAVLSWLLPGKDSRSNQQRQALLSPGFKELLLEFIRLMKVRELSTSKALSSFWKINEFLASHAWFQRIWVLQEVGSNSNVTLCMAGHRRAPWEAIAAAELFRYSFRVRVDFARNWSIPFAWFRVTPARHRGRMPVLDLLGLTSAFRATDPRDKLFAIIGLMTETASLGQRQLPAAVAPDYSKTIRRVFTDFTSWMISHHCVLDILSFASHCYRKGEQARELPSWVPDYSGSLPMLARTLGIFSNHTACGDEKVKRRMTASERVLCLEGIQVDVVSSVIEKHVRTDDDWRLVCADDNGLETAAIPYLWERIRAHISRPKNQKPWGFPIQRSKSFHALLAEFVRCLICATFPEGEYKGNRLIRQCQKIEDALESHCADWIQHDPELKAFAWSDRDLMRRLAVRGQRQDRNIFKSIAGYSLLNRQFFVTSSEKFGLAFRGIRPGDIVVILDGGPTPYVLREKRCVAGLPLIERLRRQPEYEFIGECYLEAYMDGTVRRSLSSFEASQEVNVSRRVFKII